jgi:hypothetical protein
MGTGSRAPSALAVHDIVRLRRDGFRSAHERGRLTAVIGRVVQDVPEHVFDAMRMLVPFEAVEDDDTGEHVGRQSRQEGRSVAPHLV